MSIKRLSYLSHLYTSVNFNTFKVLSCLANYYLLSFGIKFNVQISTHCFITSGLCGLEIIACLQLVIINANA